MSQQNPTPTEATAYAKNFIIHGDMTKAFRAAFPKSKATDKSANEKASVLHKHAKIQSRIEELREASKKKAEEEFAISSGKIKMMLMEAAEKGLSVKYDKVGNPIPISITGTVSALAEINKMDGNHAPVKGDISGTLNMLIAPDESDL